MAKKKKIERVTLSISEKVAILDRLQNGEKKEKILTEKGIVRRTLQRIIKAEAEIRKDAATMSPSRKRKRTGRYEEIDEWFAAVWAHKQILTGSMLPKKAKEFA